MRWLKFWLKPPIMTTSLILVFVLVLSQYRASLADQKLGGFKVEEGQKYAIVASLDFQPESFHITRLQQTGRLMRVDEKDVYLRDVSTGNLRALANKPWIETISAWNPEQGGANE